MSYIDIAIIVLVALGALIGLWKGFFKTVISFFGWLVSFIIAFFLTKIVAEALLDVSAIKKFVLGSGEGWSLFKWASSFLPADLESASGVWGVLLSPILAIAKTSGAELSTSVALLVANSIFNVMVCLGLFIAIRIVMLLFTMFANAMTQNKAIGALNRFFGFIVGAAKGLGFVCIIFIVMSFFIGTSFMTPVRNQIDKSVLGKPISQTVFKLTDKFWSADGTLMDKLLNFAGIEKTEDPDAPTEPTAEREELRTELQKALYNDAFGATGENFDALFAINDATYDGYTTNIKQYFINAETKLAAAQDGITAEQYKAMTALVSPGETEESMANATIYNALTDYLTKVRIINSTLAENPDADVSAEKAGVDTAKAALSSAIAADAGFSTLFGTITFNGPAQAESAKTATNANAKIQLAKAAPYLTFTPFAA